MHYQYGIFTHYNYFTAQWDKAQSNLTLLVFGERQVNEKEQQEAARQIGFKIKVIADCNIGHTIYKGASNYNKVMNDALAEKLGSDWNRRFTSGVDSLIRLNRDSRALKAMISKPEVKAYMAGYDSLSGVGRSRLKVEKINDSISNVYITVPYKKYSEVIAHKFHVNVYTLAIQEYLN
jgi:hypothetical protein